MPEGFLPVFSVDTEEQAKRLLVLTCSRNFAHEFEARELLAEQTLENLAAFSDRLQQAYDRLFPQENSL